MFFVVQHPFADLRGFIGPASGRLYRPLWPLANPEVDFVRSSGLVRARLGGGIEEWAGEELYGDAAHALRLPNHLGAARLGTQNVAGVVSRTFRRFHSEGTVARVEVGLRLRIDDDTTGSGQDWLALLRDILSIPVRVRVVKGQALTAHLIEAGDLLAKHYLNATTNRQLAPSAQPQDWWFAAGNPALVAEYPKSSGLVLPPHSRRVLDVPEADATLFQAWLQLGKQRCNAWFVAIGNGDRDAVRRLRINLIRLHAERECLRLTLSRIIDGSLNLAMNPEMSDAVQQYLNNTVHVMEKPTRFGLDQTGMINAARQALGVAFVGQATSLQLMRRQVLAKVEGYIRRAQNTATVINNIQGNQMNTNIQLGNVNVTGDFNLVTAANIQNSFNKAANASVSDELKEKLKGLAVEVAKLAQMLPPEEAEIASKDLESMTTEVISKKPRKEWYELSAKGLIEAAKSVAGMAAPVTTAVKAVLAILAL